MSRWLIIFLLSLPVAVRADTWTRVRHSVRPGETLRLIAREYLGVKAGARCLIPQLRLDNANFIKVGQEIEFWAPLEKFNLSDYERLNIVCTPEEVRIDGVLVTPSLTTHAPGPPQPPSTPVPVETPLPRFAIARAGAGIAYADFKESLMDSIFVGEASYQSVKGTNAWAQASYGNARIHGDAQWELGQGEFTSPSPGLKSPAYSWQAFHLFGVWEPLRANVRIGKLEVYPSVRLGLSYFNWPVALPLSQTEVTAANAFAPEAKLGLGLATDRENKWLMETELFWGRELSNGEFTSLASQLILQGAFRIERRLTPHWGAGLNWHGRYHQMLFEVRGSAGESKWLYSAAEAFLAYDL
jgi:hypothetical protein